MTTTKDTASMTRAELYAAKFSHEKSQSELITATEVSLGFGAAAGAVTMALIFAAQAPLVVAGLLVMAGTLGVASILGSMALGHEKEAAKCTAQLYPESRIAALQLALAHQASGPFQSLKHAFSKALRKIGDLKPAAPGPASSPKKEFKP